MKKYYSHIDFTRSIFQNGGGRLPHLHLRLLIIYEVNAVLQNELDITSSLLTPQLIMSRSDYVLFYNPSSIIIIVLQKAAQINFTMFLYNFS